MVQLLRKTVWQCLTKLRILLPGDLEISLIGIYPRERKDVHTKVCMWTPIAVFLVTAKSWKQPRCPPTGKKTRRLYSIHTTECSAVKEMNRWDPQKHGWILKILWSARNQAQKDTDCGIPFGWQSLKDKAVVMGNTSVVFRGYPYRGMVHWRFGGDDRTGLYPDYMKLYMA